jgi:hypothetical protein
MDKPLNINLDGDPYGRFERGSKGVEIRNDAPRWRAKYVFTGRQVRLIKGYNPRYGELHGTIGRIARAARFDDLPAWAIRGADLAANSSAKFFNRDAPVVAIEVLDLRRLA